MASKTAAIVANGGTPTPMPPHVVAVPYPGRGHVNPMLSLCRLLASRGVLVTFVVTEEWLSLLGSPDRSSSPPSLRFRTIPNVVPSEKGRGSDFPGFLDAVLTRMEAPFEELFCELQPPPSLVLTDLFLEWPSRVAARRGAGAVALWTQAVAVLLPLLRLQESLVMAEEKGDEEAINVTLEGAHSDENVWLKYMPEFGVTKTFDFEMGTFSSLWRRILKSLAWIQNGSHTLMLTSFEELEPDAIGTLRQKLPCKVYPIGPSIPYMIPMEPNMKDSEYHFNWLDSQPKSSVLYISLGSFLPVATAQMEEMAIALHSSGHRFLWVARSEIPRLQQLGGEMGLVVPWCNQLRVLCHRSVAGFLTHCGWNSVQEGVYAGKPMLAFPLFADQRPNRKLVVEMWRVGMRLRGEAMMEGGTVQRGEIEQAVRCLMDLEGDGERMEIRRRARELAEVCRRAVKEGGTSYVNLDEFAKVCKSL